MLGEVKKRREAIRQAALYSIFALVLFTGMTKLVQAASTAEGAPALAGGTGAVPARGSMPRAGGGEAKLSRPLTARIAEGKEVTLAYKLSVNGTVLEIADRKNPFIYTHGKQQIVPGLEKGLDDLKVGDKKKINVRAEDAYGPMDAKARQEVPASKLPPDVPRKVGTLVEARSSQGDVLLVKIVEIKKDSVVLDFNHPLAGKALEFQVEVLGIKQGN